MAVRPAKTAPGGLEHGVEGKVQLCLTNVNADSFKVETRWYDDPKQIINDLRSAANARWGYAQGAQKFCIGDKEVQDQNDLQSADAESTVTCYCTPLSKVVIKNWDLEHQRLLSPGVLEFDATNETTCQELSQLYEKHTEAAFSDVVFTVMPEVLHLWSGTDRKAQELACQAVLSADGCLEDVAQHRDMQQLTLYAISRSNFETVAWGLARAQLQDMGFAEGAVMEALRESHGTLMAALGKLLPGSDLAATPGKGVVANGALTPRKVDLIISGRAAHGVGLDELVGASADLATRNEAALSALQEHVVMPHQRCKSSVKVPDIEEFLSFKTYVFDCDGVIWGINEEDSKQSVATINHLLRLGKRVMFVTNNSNKRRADFMVELQSRGVDFLGRSEEETLKMVISASYTTAEYLRENGLQHPFVITSHTGILEELRLAGITEYYATVTDEGKTRPEFESPDLKGASPEIDEIIAAHPKVDCIVVGWDMGITARKVATAINYIRWHEDLNIKDPSFEQMPIIACSGDAGGVLGTVKHKGQNVKLRAIGNGAMADIIARSFDPPLEWLDMGKPSDALIELLRRPTAYAVESQTALMVGDTLQTDIVFGNRAHMATLLVLSGVTSLDEFKGTLTRWNSQRRPSYVLPKLGSLLHKFTSEAATADGSKPPLRKGTY